MWGIGWGIELGIEWGWRREEKSAGSRGRQDYYRGRERITTLDLTVTNRQNSFRVRHGDCHTPGKRLHCNQPTNEA